MEINYLKEAFQRLSLLEDDFNLSADAGVVDELKSFVADDIEAPEEEAIIDVEAETEDDLKDSYIGKVILECDCCHARIYKDIADVIIDDETGLANIEERCPVCSTESGFNVIGKIEEFNQDELKDQPKDEDEPEENVEDDIEDEDEEEFTVEESFKSALNKVLTENKHGCTTKGCDDDIELETEEVTEAVNPIMDRIRKKMLAANSLDENVEEDEVFEDPNAVEDDIQVHEAKADKLNKLHAKMAALPEGCELKEENSIMNNLRKKMMSLATDESLTEDLKEVEVKTDAGQVKVKNGFDDKVTVDFSSDAGEADEGEMIVPLNDEDIDNIEDNDEENIDDLDLEEPIEEPTEEEPLEEPIEGEEETEEATEESEEEDEEANESYKLTNEKYNSLNESKVNRYKLTNESYGWPMDLDDADPEDRARYETREEIRALEANIRDLISKRAELADVGNWDEYRHLGYKITELRSKVRKLENKLPKPTYNEACDNLEEDKFIDNREASILTGDPYEDPGFDEFDIDDFDEESYDDICESFLKRVYENAKSFKTTAVKQNKNSFIVEGIISFNSGNKKSTAFEFNKVKTLKSGKALLEGKNTTFSKSKKAFLLKANIDNKRLIPEALNYNFRAKSSLNESIAIKGRVKNK